MRYIDVLWPDDMETEYQALFAEYCDIADAEGMTDEAAFSRGVKEYIDAKASPRLKRWLVELEEIEKHPA